MKPLRVVDLRAEIWTRGRPEYEAGILPTRLRCIWERVLKRVIWIERDDIKSDWRKLYNEVGTDHSGRAV
jgi:hypothetical protein